MSVNPVPVLIRLSHARPEAAKKELDELAEEYGLYVSDWWLDVQYKFLSRATADLFANIAITVPGVLRVEIDGTEIV